MVGEAHGAASAGQQLRADIAGHDHNGVAEVGGAAPTIGEPDVVEHLQQQTKYVGVRLRRVIEHHRVRVV